MSDETNPDLEAVAAIAAEAAAALAAADPLAAALAQMPTMDPDKDRTVLAARSIIKNEMVNEKNFRGDLKEGDTLLVSGVGVDQVNPLTLQVITNGNPVIAKYDRWIEIQGGAGVIERHKL